MTVHFRTHEHRRPVAGLLVAFSLFLLTACGGSSSNGGPPGGTAPSITSISPTGKAAGAAGFILTVNGSNFLSGATVRWNGEALTTTYVNATQLTASVLAEHVASMGVVNVTVVNPAPGGGTSLAAAFTVGPPPPQSNHITSLTMQVAGMVWDATRGRIYATVPSTAANGNRVVAIDPLAGATTASALVGGDPHLIALSSDASHLWVSLDGDHAIQRLTLPGLTPDSRIDLPPDPDLGPRVALAMQAAPVNPNAFAVILGNLNTFPRDTGGVVIYDGAVPRPTQVPGGQGMTWLRWGSDDSTLYGQDFDEPRLDFDVMNVDVSGARLGTVYPHASPNTWDGQSQFDRSTGRVYACGGRAFDPATGALAGTVFPPYVWHDTCLPDPVRPVVFFLGGLESSSTAILALTAFDKNTYRRLGSLPLPGVTGGPIDLIRWGRAGLAFRTASAVSGEAAIYFVDGTFVDPTVEPDSTGGQVLKLLPAFTAITPETASVGQADLALAISGAEFQPTAKVYWNNQLLATTFQSPTQLQALVPASKLAQAGSAVISVANGTYEYAVNAMAFTVLPESSGLIVRHLSSLDIAWDAHSSRLYAPVWSADARYPNSIVAIDPGSGSISKVASVAPNPAIVRISRDGTLGYIGYQLGNLVTQFHVPALDSIVTWCLGWDDDTGPLALEDLQTAPDTPQATAIVFGSESYVTDYHGVAIYDNGIARPKGLWRYFFTYAPIQWGLTDSVLYASDDMALATVGVDATGATLLRTDPGALTLAWVKSHFDRGTGYLYTDNGYAIDPATGAHPGRYTATGLLVPDSSLNRVFILGKTSSQIGTEDYTIISFDQALFTPVSSRVMRSLVGEPVAMTRWGTSGLAIVTQNTIPGPITGPGGMLYILNDPNLVSATRTVQPGIEKVSMTLTWRPGLPAVSSSGPIKRSAGSGGKAIHR